MSNLLRKIQYAQFNSSLARRVLGLYYREGKYYRLPFGPLRGHRLYYDPSINFHAILGLWDLEGLETLRKGLVGAGVLERDAVIADVGANIGFISLWLSRLFEGRATIHAFEPAPMTLAILRKNLLVNQATGIEAVGLACSDREGETEFFVAEHHHCSSLVESWATKPSATPNAIRVKTTTLDAFFLDAGRPGPDFIKMDIEGGGVFALRGCHRVVEKYRPLMWIESHTPDEDRAISEVLVRHGYAAYRQQTRDWVQNVGATHPDPHGVWGTLLACPAEKRDRIDSALR